MKRFRVLFLLFSIFLCSKYMWGIDLQPRIVNPSEPAVDAIVIPEVGPTNRTAIPEPIVGSGPHGIKGEARQPANSNPIPVPSVLPNRNHNPHTSRDTNSQTCSMSQELVRAKIKEALDRIIVSGMQAAHFAQQEAKKESIETLQKKSVKSAFNDALSEKNLFEELNFSLRGRNCGIAAKDIASFADSDSSRRMLMDYFLQKGPELRSLGVPESLLTLLFTGNPESPLASRSEEVIASIRSGLTHVSILMDH